MTDSWNFWNSRIFNNWKIVENLEFVKDFNGIDRLGLALDELLVLINCAHDDLMRLQMLKALQECKLRIIPIIGSLLGHGDIGHEALLKVFKLKDLLKYWIITEERTFMVQVPVRDCKKFNQATLSILDA